MRDGTKVVDYISQHHHELLSDDEKIYQIWVEEWQPLVEEAERIIHN